MCKPNRNYQPEHLDPTYFDDAHEEQQIIAEQLRYDYIPNDVEDLIVLAESNLCYAG